MSFERYQSKLNNNYKHSNLTLKMKKFNSALFKPLNNSKKRIEKNDDDLNLSQLIEDTITIKKIKRNSDYKKYASSS